MNADGDPYAKSAFDFRGVSDYTPLVLQMSFLPDNTTTDSIVVPVVITDDTVSASWG